MVDIRTATAATVVVTGALLNSTRSEHRRPHRPGRRETGLVRFRLYSAAGNASGLIELVRVARDYAASTGN